MKTVEEKGKLEITIKGELKGDTALVFAVQEQCIKGLPPIVFNACDIDDVTTVIQKRLKAAQGNETF